MSGTITTPPPISTAGPNDYLIAYQPNTANGLTEVLVPVTELASVLLSDLAVALGVTQTGTSGGGGITALTASGIVAALTYQPYDAANPANFTTATSVTAQIANAVSGLVTTAALTAATTLPPIVTPGAYGKVTVSATGLVTSGGTLAAGDVSAALGFSPYNAAANAAGFAIGATVTQQIAAVSAAIPVRTGQLTNDAGFLTSANVAAAAGVPTRVGQLTNDSGYVTGAAVTTAVTSGLAVAVKTAQIDQPAGVAGRGAFGEIRYGGTLAGLILHGISTSGASVRLTADGNSAGTLNSVPIAPVSGGRVSGFYIIKNLATGDVATGDWSCVVSRSASGPPVLGNSTGGTLFSPLDTTGSSLSSAPLPTLGIDATNNCLLASYPGVAGLTLDVRMVVTNAVIY